MSDDYDQVTDVFVRINSGTRLREAELALAQLALRMPGAIADKFETAMDSYERLNYELDARFLMRAMVALGTGQSRFRNLAAFWSQKPEQLNAVWGRTQKAVDSIVNFARLNARFQISDWIPSLNAFIPLIVYFDKHRDLRDVDPLLRWFYWATLRGRYSGSAETAMDEDIKAALETDAAVALMKNIGPALTPVAADEFDDAGRLNPLFALSYAVARANGAKDWWHGTVVGRDVAGTRNRVEIHHIFPKKVLKDLKVKRKDRDEIANLAFLAREPNEKISSTPPSEYLPPIARDHPERLRAQCVPIEPDLWEPVNFHKFLVRRRELLAGAVNELLA